MTSIPPGAASTGSGSTAHAQLVVLEIGSAYTKAGFAGEGRPRVVVRTNLPLEGYRVVNGKREPVSDEDWEQLCHTLVRTVFVSKLHINPRERTVVICEGLYWPHAFKTALCRALFQYDVQLQNQLPGGHRGSIGSRRSFSGRRASSATRASATGDASASPGGDGAPRRSRRLSRLGSTVDATARTKMHVTFVPGYAMPMHAVNASSGLIVDVGFRFTRILPVLHSHAIPHLAVVVPVGMASIVQRFCKLKDGSRPAPLSFGAPPSASSPLDTAESENIHTASLTHEQIEDAVVRACFVQPLEWALDAEAGKPAPSSAAADVTFTVGHGRKLEITSEARRSACEALFGENDEKSCVVEAILECLRGVPVDSRKLLAKSLVLCGGTVLLNGFTRRIFEQLEHRLDAPEFSKELGGLRARFGVRATPHAPRHLLTWIGGSVCGYVDLKEFWISKESFVANHEKIDDWMNNDPGNGVGPRMCLRCGVKPPDQVMIPCRHLTSCRECHEQRVSTRVQQFCAFCRDPVDGALDLPPIDDDGPPFVVAPVV